MASWKLTYFHLGVFGVLAPSGLPPGGIWGPGSPLAPTWGVYGVLAAHLLPPGGCMGSWKLTCSHGWLSVGLLEALGGGGWGEVEQCDCCGCGSKPSVCNPRRRVGSCWNGGQNAETPPLHELCRQRGGSWELSRRRGVTLGAQGVMPSHGETAQGGFGWVWVGSPAVLLRAQGCVSIPGWAQSCGGCSGREGAVMQDGPSGLHCSA